MSIYDEKIIYCKNILSDDIVKLATQYAIFDEAQNFFGEYSQVPGTHSKYADPLMESILIRILPMVEEATQLNLLPTYSFYRVYRNGSELKPHIDKDSCEITLSLSFDRLFLEKTKRWPIIINDVEIEIAPGDGVIYLGSELTHSRKTLICSEDEFYVQGFFHYVNAQGRFKNLAFDKRNSIGVKK